MSEGALSRAMRINGLIAQWQKKVSGVSTNNPMRVVREPEGSRFERKPRAT
jgi:hypothetical protein